MRRMSFSEILRQEAGHGNAVHFDPTMSMKIFLFPTSIPSRLSNHAHDFQELFAPTIVEWPDERAS